MTLMLTWHLKVVFLGAATPHPGFVGAREARAAATAARPDDARWSRSHQCRSWGH